MAKRNKNRRQQVSPGAQAAPTNGPANAAPAARLSDIEARARSNATQAEIEAMKVETPRDAGSSLESLLQRASEAIALLEAQRQRLEREEANLAKRVGAIEDRARTVSEEREGIESEYKAIEEARRAVAEERSALEAAEADLVDRREEILRRELDADAGFRRRNHEALAQIEQDNDALRAQHARLRVQLEEERRSFDDELSEKRTMVLRELESERTALVANLAKVREDAEAELAMERGELVRERAELAAEAKRLRKLERDLEVERELLDEDRANLEGRVARASARLVEDKDAELKALSERLSVARSERDRMSALLSEREEAERRFGGETPEEVLKRLRSLESERDELRRALGGRPSAEAAQRLEELERQKELWETDRLRMLAELADARQEAARRRIAVAELEALRDMKRSLESANALLHEANEQLRAEMGSLVKGVEGKSPFPSCIAMDEDASMQSSQPIDEKTLDLATFAEYVRHRMAWDGSSRKGLFYSAEDVRSFLGGLAMSRLHLLQGISGTGKTSLPVAFARAIGVGHALIEVQAGWRDRQDLIGHFNTFERRFYESEFLKALYRASTPRHRDMPFIVILDEMNLSHPEQYFADLLSALEQDQQHQRLVLMTSAVDPAPRLLVDGGTKLPVPRNVWFVGTANHDETTKDFADKTYDRAHVMELPRNRTTFEVTKLKPSGSIGLDALQSAFADAASAFEAEATRAYDFLQTELSEPLGRRFHVGWGNRLQRQLSRYVPVVIAAGGDLGEATDHILATKLLRKIRDRHDNRPDDLVALRDHIQASWPVLGGDAGEPRRSLDMLRMELHRLGHDGD